MLAQCLLNSDIYNIITIEDAKIASPCELRSRRSLEVELDVLLTHGCIDLGPRSKNDQMKPC